MYVPGTSDQYGIFQDHIQTKVNHCDHYKETHKSHAKQKVNYKGTYQITVQNVIHTAKRIHDYASEKYRMQNLTHVPHGKSSIYQLQATRQIK